MICIPITARYRQHVLKEIILACLKAGCIELRMDLIEEASLSEMISAVRKTSASIPIIVTCRNQEEASLTDRFKNRLLMQKKSPGEKMRILEDAIQLGADYIDIELAEGSQRIKALRNICARRGGRTKIIISYHNLQKTPSLSSLKKIFHQMVDEKADVVKIVTFARSPDDNLKVLGLMPYAKKNAQKIIAFCLGDKGRISRVSAEFMGSMLSFAALDYGAESASGQITFDELKIVNEALYGVKKNIAYPVSSQTENQSQNYVLLGNPTHQSMSPLMHNAALTELGVAGRYNAFCVSDLNAALQGMRGMNIRGASVTIPFKVEAMEMLDDIDDDALKIGAINTIVNNNGRLFGYNTDWRGLLTTIKQAMTIRGKKFVIIGAGGTARAALFAVLKEGGHPIIVNRSKEKGEILAKIFGCPFYELRDIKKIKAHCLINTTPIGMYPNTDQSPVDADAIFGYEYVMDVIYNPLKTKILRDAERAGCRILSGLDMFVHQGAEQIILWTGREPNRLMMKAAVEKMLSQD